MSHRLLHSIIKSVSQALPKYSISVQVRSVAAMDVAQANTVLTTEVKTTEVNASAKTNIISNKTNTRFALRQRHKRQWEEPGTSQDREANVRKRLCNVDGEVVKRKKMALLLGYCGVDYYGMQRNPGVKTIEEDLLKALLDANYITEDDYNNQQEAHFQRSSRTDKGVSAARQVVSLKLPVDVDIQEINKRMPECIRVFGVRRVTNKFNSKLNSNARTYSYLLPTSAFEANLKTMEDRMKYRMSSDRIEEIAKVLDFYKGTNTYYNFTEKKNYTDPSSLRYIMNVTFERVFVHSGMEFAVVLIKGQSFMLHQIRKMIGLALAVIRGHCEIDIMKKAFTQEKLRIPTAPGLGLVLDQVHYDRYNEKHKETHAALCWRAEEAEVDKFKQDYIYPVIIKGEIEGNSMFEWLEKLEYHSFDPNVEMGPPEDNKMETSDSKIDENLKSETPIQETSKEEIEDTKSKGNELNVKDNSEERDNSISVDGSSNNQEQSPATPEKV